MSENNKKEDNKIDEASVNNETDANHESQEKEETADTQSEENTASEGANESTDTQSEENTASEEANESTDTQSEENTASEEANESTDTQSEENTASEDTDKTSNKNHLHTLGNVSEEAARAKKRKKILRKRRAKNIFTVFLILILVVYTVIGVVGGKYALSLLDGMAELKIDDLISEESSKIYDTNGNLITEIGTYYRENISYDQCPESLIDAFLSIEDSRFFEHNGFDIPRFTKAAIETLMGQDGGGGSTFTMQLIKNSYFSIDDGDNSTTRERTIEYKVQQIVLSLELETQLSKKEIFELYMNKLNFGDRIRGVEKAAKYYFGKSASQMSLSESALLAGIVNLPNQYNPYHYLDEATARRNQVLYLMLQHGYIDEEEYTLAKSINVEDQLVGAEELEKDTENNQYAEYVDVVIEEAVAMTGKDPVIYGMDIYTAMEPAIQERIEEIENGDLIYYPNDLMQCAIVSMNNKNGEIVGVGGGRSYEGGSRLLNRATSQYKQPGSSVKPILSYALGFEYLGYSLDEVLMDKPLTFPGEGRLLQNADGQFRGELRIKDAIAHSYNIPAILTLEHVTAKIGSEAIVNYMQSLGFTQASNDTYHMSYAIGGNEFTTTVKELAGAHAAIVNLGVYNEPHTIRKLVTTEGEVYYPENQNIRVLSSGSAYLTDQLMEYNVSGGVYNYMQVLYRNYPVYAKTGTTDWGTDGLQYGIPEGAGKDKWMVASTSQYTNAVWIGFDKAVAGGACYISTWMDMLNTTGKMQLQLLDAEESTASDLSGVQMPGDVQTVTYADGTWPHIANGVGTQITSLVSSTGLTNTPTIYASGQETNFAASLSNNILYIDWGAKKGCSGGTQDISLNNPYGESKSASGACLVSNSWAYGTNPSFVAEIYQDGNYVTTVTSTDGMYGGYGGYLDSGAITACGWWSNGTTTSNAQCVMVKDWTQSDTTE